MTWGRGLRLSLAVLTAVAVTPFAVQAARSAPQPPSWTSGVVLNSVSGAKAFGTLRGRPVEVVTDYLGTSTWASMTDVSWAVRRYAGSGIHVVWSLPMLPNNDPGTLEEEAKGTYNQYFQTIAQGLVAGGQGSSTIRIGWEMTGNWFKWSALNDPAAYAESWRQIVDVFRSVPGQNFTFDFNISHSAIDPRPMYPGDAYVDFMGLDVYDWAWSPDYPASNHAAVWNSIITRPFGLGWISSWAAEHHKRLSLPEWGLKARCDGSGGGDDPYFIQQMYTWFSTHDVAYETYFDNDDDSCSLSTMGKGTFPQAEALYNQLWDTDPATPWPTGTAPAAPFDVTTTAGDGQAAVSWTTPSTGGGGPITGYTATFSPGGATCTATTAAGCTVTGLTDAVTYTVTVTATNAAGTGPASVAATVTPYPASVMSAANGLSLWLDGADPTTTFGDAACTVAATTPGTSVGCWTDKSGRGENFVQPSAANQPVVGALGGHSAVTMPSAAAVLGSVDGADTYQTVFVVTRLTAGPTGFDYVFGRADSDFSLRVPNPGNANDWSYGTGSPSLSWTSTRQGASPTFGVPAILTAQSAIPNTFAASVSSTFMGRGLVGDVAEVVAFSGTLTADQRATVENYLARKWSVALPPGAPTGLKLTAGESALRATWSPPATGSPATGYVVTAQPTGRTCATTTALTCTISGLADGTSYTLSVVALNNTGTGPAASSVGVPSAAPAAPTGVAATPAHGSLTVGWSAPVTTGGNPITGYTVRSTPGTATCTSTGATTCTLTGLTDGVRYSLSVTAKNAKGTGPASAAVTAVAGTGAAAPGAPTGVSLVAGDRTMTVSWTPPPVTGGSAISGYTATATPGGASCTSTGTTTCTLTGLSDGVTLSVTVTASNVVGRGPASPPASATPYPASVMGSAAGLSLWLDGANPASLFQAASCTGTNPSTGAPIGCWKDLSGSGNDMIQTSATAQPTVGTLNGLAAPNFDNTGEVLATLAAGTYQTVFVVAAPQAGQSGLQYLFGQSGGDTSVRVGCACQTSPNGNDWSWATGSPTLAWSNGRQAVSPTLGTTSVLSAQSATPFTFPASVSTTFAGNSAQPRGTIGRIAEVVAFQGTLTTAQRRAVEDYLGRKWTVGLTPDPTGVPKVTIASTSSVTVSWARPAFDGGRSVASYTATATPGGATCTTTTATSCTLTGLTHGTAYTVSVTAGNTVGTGPPSAASATVTP